MKRLHAALMRFGGPQRWALELGVPLERHRPGPRLSSAMIEAELRDLLRKHRPLRCPTAAWLRPTRTGGRRGPTHGGGARWAHVLNMGSLALNVGEVRGVVAG